MQTDIVYFKDARNMEEVDDNSVRLIITSPPYWNVKDYSLNGTQDLKHTEKIDGQIGDVDDFEKYIDEMVPVWKECERVLKPNGRLCVNTPLMPIAKEVLTTHYNRHIVDINAGIEHSILHKTGLFLFDMYIWNRTNWSKNLVWGSFPHPPNLFVRNAIEFITIYVKDGVPDPVSKEIRAKSKLSQSKFLEFTKQVWDLPVPNKADKAYGKHTAIMPKEMAERLVLLFSFYNDIVLDPFCGSGTTLEVAQRFKRKYIGYEIYESYKNVIKNKLDQLMIPFKNNDPRMVTEKSLFCKACNKFISPEFSFCPFCGKRREN